MILRILICLILFSSFLNAFDKVVIWGYKLHSHTHSYIHYGFFRAFEKLGFKTFWFDDNDDVSKFDFSDSLFLSIGGQEKNMPLREDCFYILHNWDYAKYRELHKKNKAIYMQVFTTDVLNDPNNIEKEPFIYYNFVDKGVHLPWATDLLPEEIDGIKKELVAAKHENKVFWIGTIGDNKSELKGFRRACKKAKVEFVHNDPWAKPADMLESRQMIMKSYIAPAIVGAWQKEKGYIPCRIFKNISYGQMGVTNSKYVYELFQKKIVYNPDTYKLFFEAKKRIKNVKLEEIYELMDFVKTKHTYINRVKTLLNFIEQIQNPK